MAILGSGQRLPRGPLGFLAGLVGGLEPSMPNILAAQKRRREEAEKKSELPARGKRRPGPNSSGSGAGNSREPEAGSPLPGTTTPRTPAPGNPSGEESTPLDPPQTRRGEGGYPPAAFPARYARGGSVGQLTRLLSGSGPGTPGAGQGPLRGAGGRIPGAGPRGSDADRYAQHLLRGGMPPELVQQLRAQYEA